MRARIQKISKHVPSIFQGKLDFSSKGRGISLTVEHPTERAIFRFLIVAFGALVLFYLYFVFASVLNVIARKEALSKSASLANTVSELEQDYFAAAQSIGPEDGTRLGLSPVANIVYVRRPGNAAAIALPSNEI